MTGLVKPRKIDFKDTNLALFGSDVERNVKKSAAMEEKAWKGCGKRVGLKIWRIEKFKVVEWPSEDYGSFYEGDSYIILRTYKKDPKSEELDYDVHFWIGKYSSQDEYGTAAYKTVELDTYLDDKPIQHREVMDHESDLFKSYFKVMSKWKGGVESGFRRVEPKMYQPRLIHVCGDQSAVTFKEVKYKKEYLNDGDVFIIDLGLEIFQWNGDNSNKNEKFSGGQFARDLKSTRGGKPNLIVLDNAVTDPLPEELMDKFPGEGQAGTKRPKDKTDGRKQFEKILFRLSDASQEMKFEEVARGKSVTKSALDSNDVFVLDTGRHCFVWIGKDASPGEDRNGLIRAHSYLKNSECPLQPITVVREGKENSDFHKAF